MEECKAFLGDCLDVLPHLPRERFSLILTDPPYEISRPNNFKTMGRSGIDFGKWDVGFDQYTWIDLALPLLQPGGSIVIFNDCWKVGEIGSYLENKGMLKKRVLVWEKTNPAPFNAKRGFLQGSELAVWAIKPPRKLGIYNGGYHKGVFSHAIPKKRQHPTKKPTELFKTLIEKLTNEGDWILDPFAGEGTTAEAALSLNRRFVVCEKETKYYNLIQELL